MAGSMHIVPTSCAWPICNGRIVKVENAMMKRISIGKATLFN